jgi:large subunit ribosomal protein L24
MSQLTQAPLHSAKHLKKLKEIKQVETAIKWHERARKKRQALAEDRWQAKQVAVQRIKWEKRNVIRVRRAVIRRAHEDYIMGPLRPNRAFGQHGEKYGVMTSDMLRRPSIPVKVHKQRNEIREKKGWEIEYPLVVDDQKYFPIVEGDRVVVMKGREKGKIGIVSDVVEFSHEVIIKDVNKVCGIDVIDCAPAYIL